VGSVFGTIISAGAVERAVADSLREWISTYIGEIERIEGYDPGSIERPLDVISTSDFEKWPEDQLPVVLVLNAGLAGQPIRRGDGVHEATWLVALAPVVSDVNAADTRTLALAYAAAIRAAILQHKSLGGFAAGLTWRDENYTDLPFADTRSLMAGRVVFEVTVEGVVRDSGGPPAPLPDPSDDPGDWPTTSEVETIVEPEAITA
jgi:hypothetical protein